MNRSDFLKALGVAIVAPKVLIPKNEFTASDVVNHFYRNGDIILHRCGGKSWYSNGKFISINREPLSNPIGPIYRAYQER